MIVRYNIFKSDRKMFPVMPTEKKKKKVASKPGEARLQSSRMGEDPRKPGLPPTQPLPDCEHLGQPFKLDEYWPINQKSSSKYRPYMYY